MPAIPTTALRIFKKASCPKLSSRASGQLTYHVACDPDGAISLRVTGNEGGGFFSNEYVSLTVIQEEIASHGNAPFKALAFRTLFKSRGANNHGFLAAVLRAEGLLIAHPDSPLNHTAADATPFLAAMTKLMKSKVDLHDDVAEAAAIKAKAQEERIARFKGMVAAKAAESASKATSASDAAVPAQKKSA